MSEESSEEMKEKSTALIHLTTAAFPADHLAPWMSVGNKREIALRAVMKTIAQVGEELDRQVWMKDNPDEEAPAADEPDTVFFDTSKVTGAAYMFGFGLNSLATNLHDFAVSENGLGRRQAMSSSIAQKSGVAVEPKKRSLLDKIRGKNKESEQTSGGS